MIAETHHTANLHSEIRELESILRSEKLRLLEAQARVVLLASPIPFVRSIYPNTSISYTGKSTFEWLTLVHEEWVNDTREELAKAKLELLIRLHLSDAVTDVERFLGRINEAIHLHGSVQSWQVCYTTIEALAQALGIDLQERLNPST